MQGGSAQGALFILGAAIAAVSFIGVVFGANALLSPRRPTEVKLEPYECGMPQAGPAWNPVRLRFSTVAVLFVIFDAESALLFAVASGVRGSFAGFVEVAAFVAFLAGGLAYAWRKGALTWQS